MIFQMAFMREAGESPPRYDSRRFRRLLDGGGVKRNHPLKMVAPHPNANFFDHDFLSPTFAETIERHIKNYIEDYGGVQ